MLTNKNTQIAVGVAGVAIILASLYFMMMKRKQDDPVAVQDESELLQFIKGPATAPVGFNMVLFIVGLFIVATVLYFMSQQASSAYTYGRGRAGRFGKYLPQM